MSGEITNLHAGLRLSPDAAPQVGLTFDFDGAEVRALRGMAPVSDGQGYLDISHNRVSIALHEGHVTAPDGGRLDLAGSLMRIHDTRQRFSPATLDLQIAGAIPSAMTLIAAEPFNLLDRFPLDPASVAQGRVEIASTVDMVLQPRIMPEDLTFGVEASLRGVASDQLVPGRSLRRRRAATRGGQHAALHRWCGADRRDAGRRDVVARSAPEAPSPAPWRAPRR